MPDQLKPGDYVVSKISGELARIMLINLPYVLVRYQADPLRKRLRFYRDFKLKEARK